MAAEVIGNKNAGGNTYFVSTEKTLLNADLIHAFLSGSYWAEGIPRETVDRCIENSLCFGAYLNGEQVGFARIVSDFASFAYLADVFVLEAHRGNGVSHLIMKAVVGHPQLQGLRRMILATRDAHGLYAQYGFTAVKNPDRWMEIHDPDVYKRR